MRIKSIAVSGDVIWALQVFEGGKRIEIKEHRRGISVLFDENVNTNPHISFPDVYIEFKGCKEIYAKPFSKIKLLEDQPFSKKLKVFSAVGEFLIEAQYITDVKLLELLIRNGILEFMIVTSFETSGHPDGEIGGEQMWQRNSGGILLPT